MIEYLAAILFYLTIIFFACVSAGLVFKYFYPDVIVSGDSMSPTYVDGEKLLATRLFSTKKLEIGDVVVFYPPYAPYPVIKRIYSIETGARGRLKFTLYGDNKDFSYDSRHYGCVEEGGIICILVRKHQRPMGRENGLQNF